jgi:sulfur-oxidizing protein SoxY
MTLIAPTRRKLIGMALAMPLVLRIGPAGATPEAMQAAIDAFTGGAVPQEGRVTLEIPVLVQNGNAVPLTVSTESPMTEDDHVETIAIFNEVNPLPDTARFHFTPASGVAQTQTRIRLNGDQHVHAVARMSDGSFWTASANVIVTAPACRES